MTWEGLSLVQKVLVVLIVPGFFVGWPLGVIGMGEDVQGRPKQAQRYYIASLMVMAISVTAFVVAVILRVFWPTLLNRVTF